MFPLFNAVIHNGLDVLPLGRCQPGILGDVVQHSFQVIEVLLCRHGVMA
jgi:hypothetical protein